jgi:nitroreductase
MDAIEAIRTRRSVRAYQDRPVARDLIEAVIADAAHAPWTPGALPEPWVFNVIEGRAAVAAYGARALDYARANRPRLQGYEWTERPGFSVFHEAPAVIIISGRSDYAPAQGESTRAGQNLSLSAHARGLGSCWVGSPMLWIGDAAVQRELGIPEGLTPFAVFTLGYAAATPDPPTPLQPRILWNA